MANISSIKQGSFDSTFDDDFVLRTKSPNVKNETDDTGVHTFSFAESDQKCLDGPDYSDLIQIGTIKLKSAENENDKTFSLRVLECKVNDKIRKYSTVILKLSHEN